LRQHSELLADLARGLALGQLDFGLPKLPDDLFSSVAFSRHTLFPLSPILAI
jgi:hypothetical protein